MGKYSGADYVRVFLFAGRGGRGGIFGESYCNKLFKQVRSNCQPHKNHCNTKRYRRNSI